jgi:hypothetical protein
MVERRGKMLAVLLIQRLWRRAKLRIRLRNLTEDARMNVTVLRDAARRYVLFSRIREKYPPAEAQTLMDFFDATRMYPPVNEQ